MVVKCQLLIQSRLEIEFWSHGGMWLGRYMSDEMNAFPKVFFGILHLEFDSCLRKEMGKNLSFNYYQIPLRSS